MSRGDRKPAVRASDGVAYALVKLSKNAIIDMLVDRAIAQCGEDATEDAIISVLQDWLEPIARLRDEKPLDLVGRLSWFETYMRNKIGSGGPGGESDDEVH